MENKISLIIQADELLKLYPSKDLILVDARNEEAYQKSHLDTAVFVDLNSDLADIKEDFAIGGRHPLPEIENFAETLKNIGITKESHIVVYDDKNGANASARFWWMLKSIGHEKVQVLNGGLQQAIKVNFPINDKTETPKVVEDYNYENWKLKIADMAEVESNSLNENHIIIDVRESNRYKGISEPIDLIAGHIPGAINVPFSTNLAEDGQFLSPDLLKQKYQKLFGDIKSENVIVHCGSGVTACHTLLALDYAGLEIPKLYVGSWSEWSRNNKTIATEE
ncbi:sulfurtransferase [Brumimicrobium glaciale]|uniref:Sulfurtransferase n=1 Tax=Brumimicrobium glaciale TaxID=200475 RepID=A0A4Q4KIT2_9FLAO|nr:sulfurtransferase [Brumimicrobium glaciale]RYM32154.1 sulfurtransferase [Brumimicrobium glaciale]